MCNTWQFWWRDLGMVSLLNDHFKKRRLSTVTSNNGSTKNTCIELLARDICGGGLTNILYFHPQIGEDSRFDQYSSDGLVQPPPRHLLFHYLRLPGWLSGWVGVVESEGRIVERKVSLGEARGETEISHHGNPTFLGDQNRWPYQLVGRIFVHQLRIAWQYPSVSRMPLK